MPTAFDPDEWKTVSKGNAVIWVRRSAEETARIRADRLPGQTEPEADALAPRDAECGQ